jgi:hypothetical protein
MDRDGELRDVDRWLRAASAPDAVTVRRVVSRALDDRSLARSRRTQLAFGGVAAALAAIVAALLTVSRSPGRAAVPRGDLSVSIVRRGSLLAVERSDGVRSIVGAAPERARRGRYVIVVKQ